MIEADTPTLWDIRQRLGHAAAVAILVNAFIHAAKLVNLDKNLTIEQIGEAANDTLDSYGYLKVEEVKFLLKRALRTQNVYGRLDYNVLMNWVEQYDAERTEQAIDISHNEEVEAQRRVSDNPEGKDFKTYLAELKERAKTDKSAAKLLANYEAIQSVPTIGATRKNDDHKFKLFKYDYLLRKKRNET